MIEDHATRHRVPGTDVDIQVADPDQGTLHVVLTHPPVGQIDVWEPFTDGTAGGHNLFGFLERWKAFLAGSEPWLTVLEPRYGHPAVIGRGAIDKVAWIGLGYRKREDTRAGVRGSPLAVPGGGMRRLPNGDIEIMVPTGSR